MLGLKGIKVDKPEDLKLTLDEAISANRPVVCEAYSDLEVPPMLPHIKTGQALDSVKASLNQLARKPLALLGIGPIGL